jgi:hypothetical protein
MSTIYYDLKYSVFKDVLVGKLGLSQMIRFLMVELINLDSNSRFDCECCIFMTNYSFNDI